MKSKTGAHRLNWLRSLKDYLRCSYCGEPEGVCLDFHHRDPRTKDDSLTPLIIRGSNIDVIEAELDKCDVVCANCHRRIHYSPSGHLMQRNLAIVDGNEQRIELAISWLRGQQFSFSKNRKKNAIQHKIKQFLDKNGPSTVKQVSLGIGKSAESVRKIISRHKYSESLGFDRIGEDRKRRR